MSINSISREKTEDGTQARISLKLPYSFFIHSQYFLGFTLLKRIKNLKTELGFGTQFVVWLSQ